MAPSTSPSAAAAARANSIASSTPARSRRRRSTPARRPARPSERSGATSKPSINARTIRPRRSPGPSRSWRITISSSAPPPAWRSNTSRSSSGRPRRSRPPIRMPSSRPPSPWPTRLSQWPRRRCSPLSIVSTPRPSTSPAESTSRGPTSSRSSASASPRPRPRLGSQAAWGRCFPPAISTSIVNCRACSWPCGRRASCRNSWACWPRRRNRPPPRTSPRARPISGSCSSAMPSTATPSAPRSRSGQTCSRSTTPMCCGPWARRMPGALPIARATTSGLPGHGTGPAGTAFASFSRTSSSRASRTSPTPKKWRSRRSGFASPTCRRRCRSRRARAGRGQWTRCWRWPPGRMPKASRRAATSSTASGHSQRPAASSAIAMARRAAPRGPISRRSPADSNSRTSSRRSSIRARSCQTNTRRASCRRPMARW